MYNNKINNLIKLTKCRMRRPAYGNFDYFQSRKNNSGKKTFVFNFLDMNLHDNEKLYVYILYVCYNKFIIMTKNKHTFQKKINSYCTITK